MRLIALLVVLLLGGLMVTRGGWLTRGANPGADPAAGGAPAAVATPAQTIRRMEQATDAASRAERKRQEDTLKLLP